MKVALISPTSLIEKYGNQGHFHLALAHLLGSPNEEANDYEKALLASNKPIYLDNGLFENKVSVPVRELIGKAVNIGAEYVFAPDVIYDKQGTLDNIDEAYEVLQEFNYEFGGDTKLAAVVQADNEKDFVDGYVRMASDTRISLIGLSILSIPKSFGGEISDSRIRCLQVLNSLPSKKISHLLGAGNHYKDVMYAAEHNPWVISHDSSSAIWNGIQEHAIRPDLTIDGGKTKVPVDFNFNRELTQLQKNIIQSNINIVLETCK